MSLRCYLEQCDTSRPDITALTVHYFFAIFVAGNYFWSKIRVSALRSSYQVILLVLEALALAEIIQYKILICPDQLEVLWFDVTVGHFCLDVTHVEGGNELARPFPDFFACRFLNHVVQR